MDGATLDFLIDLLKSGKKVEDFMKASGDEYELDADINKWMQFCKLYNDMVVGKPILQ